MQLLTRPSQRKWPFFFYAGPPVAVTMLLWWSSFYEVPVRQGVAAFALACIPWSLYRKWSQGQKREIPLFVLITGMFWFAYAVPLFWGSHDIGLVDGKHHLSEESLTNSLYLALVGVFALLGGMKIVQWIGWMPTISWDVSSDPSRWKYLRVVLVSATLLWIFVPINVWGSGGRQIISNLENILPAVTFAILFRYCMRGKASDLDRFLILAYGALALVLGMSSGWLGSFVGLGLICTAVYIYERRRLPVTAIFVILPVVLFFQPAKKEFRNRFWRSDSTASYSQRITFWASQSWRMWSTAIDDPTGEGGRTLADSTLQRFSLLQQTANVMRLTPEVVPYQYGRLYSYMWITLIPRFIWPGKPSVNDANRWYQVSYRLTAPRELRSVSIAVGTLAESYINFGWFGPLLVMLPLGIFLELFNRTFLPHTSGMLANSLGVVLLPGLIGIESQLAEYVAGLAQQIVIALVVLIPELEFRNRNVFAQRMFLPRLDPLVRLKSRATGSPTIR